MSREPRLRYKNAENRRDLIGSAEVRRVPKEEIIHMGMPTVSIITPTYNRASVKRAIVSAISSSTPYSVECIVVDDCSSPQYVDDIELFAEQIPITLLRNSENRGPGYSRNSALTHARGKYVFFLDSDDILAPGGLSRLVSEAESSSADIVLPMVIAATGRIHGNLSVADACSARSFADCAAIKSLSPSKLIRHDLIIENRIKFAEDRYWGEDQSFVLRCYLASKRISILMRAADLFILDDQITRLTRRPSLRDVMTTIVEVIELANTMPLLSVEREIILSRVFNSDVSMLLLSLKRNPELDSLRAEVARRITNCIDEYTKKLIDISVWQDLETLSAKH